MALPVLNRGKLIRTDDLYDFATRQIYPIDEHMLDLAGAIVALAEAVENQGSEGLYLTCSTAANTAAKTIDCEGYELKVGRIFTVIFSSGNTSNSPTLNINNTGAKTIYRVAQSANNACWIDANDRVLMVYDGSGYQILGTASTDAAYGTCTTEEATTDKVVTCGGYKLHRGGLISVKFTYAVPASSTLNVNGRGAKSIYQNGAAITAGVIGADNTALFVYNGTQYELLCVSVTGGGGGSTRSMTNQEIDNIWDSVFNPEEEGGE